MQQFGDDVDKTDGETLLSEGCIRLNPWFSAKLQYLQCGSNGYTAVLHWAIKIGIANIPTISIVHA